MSESKIEIVHRLDREGRWPEASKFKDETVRKLRAEGTKRREAADAAWDAMAAKFPPLPPPTESRESVDQRLFELAYDTVERWATRNNFSISTRVLNGLPYLLMYFWMCGKAGVFPDDLLPRAGKN